MTTFTAPLTLDEEQGCIEDEFAEFQIDAEFEGRPGHRRLIAASAATLIAWRFGDRMQTRETAVKLAGEAWVLRQEATARDRYLATAEADDADAYADYRHDLAAE